MANRRRSSIRRSGRAGNVDVTGTHRVGPVRQVGFLRGHIKERRQRPPGHRDRRLDAGQALDDIAGDRIVFAAQQAGELDSTCVGAQPGTKIGGRLIIPAAAVDAMADAAAFTAEGCVAGSVGELNDGAYRAGREGAGQRSSSWGRVCPVLGFRPGGGCVSC